MRWPWDRAQHRGEDEQAAAERREQELKLEVARRQTPTIERAAERLAQLPPDVFAERVRRAMGA